jgi:TM2 domain-containing membrane protein YozV
MEDNLFKGLSLNQMIIIEDRIKKECKSPKKALLMWFIGACWGFHRFYLGMYGTGLKAFTASFLSFGLAGIYIAIHDYKNMNHLLEEANKETLLNIIKDVKRV